MPTASQCFFRASNSFFQKESCFLKSSYWLLVGSLLVSYTRARAEAVQIECKEGFFQRTERIVVLILGLVSLYLVRGS